MRALELYCGIGGFAEALAPLVEEAEIVDAIDLAEHPLELYRHNHDHPTRQVDIALMAPRALADYRAELWWMSPPCQPYTTRGHRRDLDDPRAASLRHLVDAVLEVARPPWLAMENVEGFRGSRAHALLWTKLDALGYDIAERTLCPSALGVPNRRPRYYLVASRDGTLREHRPAPPPQPKPLSRFVDPRHDDDEALYVDPAALARHGPGMRILDLEATPAAVANCFTAAYGKTYQAAGAYLRRPRGVRRFAPEEIAALLGFRAGWSFPAHVSLKRRWRHLGNSLSIWAVREVLRTLPCLPSR